MTELKTEAVVKDKEAVEKNTETAPKKAPGRKATTKRTPKKKVFDKEELIPCMSVTTGLLILNETSTKSHTRYEWLQYGDITDVEYQDLKTMIARKSDFLFYPYFIIMDEDFLKENERLKEVSEHFYGLDDPYSFFDRPPEVLKTFLANAPEGVRDAARSAASTLIKSGELDSVSKVKVIDQALGTEFKKLLF